MRFVWIGVVAGSALLFASPGRAELALDMSWDPGAEQCTPELRRTESHAIDAATIAIRQNPCVDFEAPILYLLLGEERALLIDSGASDDPAITAELTRLVDGFRTREDGTRLPLVVAHTHGHQDHRAGDAAFATLPDVTVVPHEGDAMRRYFGFRNWPNDELRFDLGRRELVLQPTPGHHPDHVVFYDLRTRLLFTGDFYLPGRLLVDDTRTYTDSAMRMVEFVQVWSVHRALGAHIEMNARGEWYPGGASFHPDEASIALPFGIPETVELHGALQDFNGFYNRHARFAISHPIHNLAALGAGVLLALALLVWGVRKILKRRRAATA